MACLVKRSKDSTIKEVMTPNGKKSSVYQDILNEVKDGVPSEVVLNVSQSLSPFVGKFINNLTDPKEVALGLYANIYSKSFMSWYGEDWTVTGNEPKLFTKDGLKVFRNSKGEIRSIYNTGRVAQTKPEYYKLVANKRTAKLIDYVKKSVQILNLRIKEARQLRDRVNNDPKLSADEKRKKTKYYNDIISTAIEQKTQLKENNELKYVFLLAETDLDMVNDVLYNSKSTMGEVRVAYRAVQAWKNITKVLGVKDLSDLTEEDRNRVSNIEAKAIEYNRRLVDLSVKLIAQAFSTEDKVIDPKNLYNEMLGLPEVSWITAQARDISTTGVPLINLLAKLIQESNLKIDKEHYKVHDIIDDAFNKIKNHSEIKSNGFSIFLKEQTNVAGEKTLGLVGPYSQKYYDTIRAKRKVLNVALDNAGSDKAKRKEAYDNYNSWLAKNTFIFNAVPFLEKDKYSDAEREASVNEILQLGLTRDEARGIVKESEKLYERYLEVKQDYISDREVDIENGKIDVPEGQSREDFIKELEEKWENENSPIKFIEQMKQPTLIGNYAFKGMYYTIKVPLKGVDGKATGYYDANFSRIASDPVLYEWYNFFQNTINQSLSYMPEEEVDELQSNFLPVITERLAQEYGLTNIKGLTKGIGDWFMNVFTAVEYDSRQTKDPVTGEVINTIQPKFINESVPVEERSKDMVIMLKMFTDMSLVYKHKLQVQDYVDSIGQIVKGTNVVTEENVFGEAVADPSRAPLNLKSMVDSEIKRSFYRTLPDDSRLEKKLVSKRKFYSSAELLTLGLVKSEKYKRAKAIEEEVKVLNKELEKEDLTEKEATDLQNKIDALKIEYNNLGGRSFSLTKTLDSNIAFTRVLSLALQPFSALRNLVIGGVNNVVHSAGGRDFNFADLRKATSMVKNNILKFWTKGSIITNDALKLIKFMNDTGIVEGEDGIFKSKIIGNKSTAQEVMSKFPNAFTLMKGTDFIFKSQTALAMSFNQKIKTEKGEFHIYEVMNDNLEFDTEKYGEYDPSLNGNKSFEEVYDKFMLKVGQVGKKLHGLATSRTGLKGKDTIWGRLLFLFKSWLPETVANRFEKKKYDEFLDREVEGYYRTFGKKFGEEGLGVFRSMLRALFSDEVEDMDELERENLRKFGAELASIISIYMIYFTLKAMAPDEDDEDRKIWNVLLNQIELIGRDLTYYISPGSAGDITEQIVPIVRTADQVGAALKAVTYYSLGIEDEDGEPQYDSERTLQKVTKVLPVINNYNRFIYYEKKLTDVR